MEVSHRPDSDLVHFSNHHQIYNNCNATFNALTTLFFTHENLTRTYLSIYIIHHCKYSGNPNPNSLTQSHISLCGAIVLNTRLFTICRMFHGSSLEHNGQNKGSFLNHCQSNQKEPTSNRLTHDITLTHENIIQYKIGL